MLIVDKTQFVQKLDQIELQLDRSQLPYSEYQGPIPQQAAQLDLTKKGPLHSSSDQDKPIPCKDGCCRNKIINVLSKQEELLLDLIEEIEDPVVKAQKLSAFHGTLVRETSKPETKIQEPKVDLEKIYNRFTKNTKEVTVNDLQREIKETKSEVRTLKQELNILRVDKNFLDQRLKQIEHTSHQGNEEGPSFHSHSNDEYGIVNPIVDMVQEQSSEKFLDTISRINFQKWHSKIRIVISKDFEFEVIALIDSGADLNCIQEGIIPFKYFRKTRERLTSANGGKMQILNSRSPKPMFAKTRFASKRHLLFSRI